MTPSYRIEGIIGEGAARAAPLAEALKSAASGPVTILINSPGGDAFEGAAMLAELQRHPGKVTVLIEGIAASAASLIAMGGAEIVMDRTAVMMIHDPGAVTIGNAAAHRQSAETLERLAGVYAEAYARATGNPVKRVRAWMQAETWLTAEEAVSLHFADRVAEAPEAARPAAYAYATFRHAPEHLVRMAAQLGWATLSPETEQEAANHGA